MENNNLHRFKEEMQSYEELPSDRAWNRINDKIQIRNNKRTVQWYRWIAVAASTIAIVSVYSIYQHNIHKHNPKMFAYNSIKTDAKPTIIEELEVLTNDGIYAIEQVADLNQAYSNEPYSHFKEKHIR